MKIEKQQIIYGSFLVGLAIVLYFGRAVVAPFILAAIFAYVLNPLVDFLAHRMKLPRGLSVAIIYIILIGLIAVVAIGVGLRLSEESAEFSWQTRKFLQETSLQISKLPGWLQPVSLDFYDSIRATLLFPAHKIISYIPGALNRTISLLVFLTAGFYFLKDGRKFKNDFLALLPGTAGKEAGIIISKINAVLGNYLRGELLLVLIMSTLTYLGLLIIGVHYSLILAVFTGFAEIIPFVGPFIAGAVAVLIAFTDQYSRLGFSPVLDVVAVASLYTILRQFEDLFIIPQVLGRMTKLHPLMVLFSVLVGGHIFGIVGYLLAVPFTASVKVVYDHLTKKPRLAGEAGPESE